MIHLAESHQLLRKLFKAKHRLISAFKILKSFVLLLSGVGFSKQLCMSCATHFKCWVKKSVFCAMKCDLIQHKKNLLHANHATLSVTFCDVIFCWMTFVFSYCHLEVWPCSAVTFIASPCHWPDLHNLHGTSDCSGHNGPREPFSFL